MRHRVAFGLLAAMVLIAGACGGDDDDEAIEQETETEAGAAEELVGLFTVTPGVCSDAGVTEGSYFRMIQPDGEPEAGPFVPNGDSPCGDKTWAPMKPGSDGGLITGQFQSYPDPVFDDSGNGTAAKITEPTVWFAVTFANATNETDPQTEKATTAPTVTAEGGKLSGDLSAFAAAWNGQHFNQGAPKPGGERPGITTGPTGTYDEATGAYTLDWRSQIVGGPFNDFTGVWHLEGTFEPA